MQADKQDLAKLYNYEESQVINKDLENIYKLMEKEFKRSKHPDSIVQRIFVDTFGVIVLYLVFFFLCDFTRSAILRTPYFGLTWLIFGPYYFFTGAPFMTRIWKSKKFLEDLAEASSDGLTYDPSKTCTQEGTYYKIGCEKEENHPHNHPVRDHLGKGLDWILRHSIGQHLGGVLGNSTCQDQSTTIAKDCANQRLQRAWNCYLFICNQHGVVNVAPNIDWPNTINSGNQQTRGWDTRSIQAYTLYSEVYNALYSVGSSVTGSASRPENLNPNFDVTNNYCINGATLFSYPVRNDPPSGFGQPPWWIAEEGSYQGPCYYQNNYSNHLLDYWDPV